MTRRSSCQVARSSGNRQGRSVLLFANESPLPWSQSDILTKTGRCDSVGPT
jgi:hypothetical protein